MKTLRVVLFLFLTVVVSQFLFPSSEGSVAAQGSDRSIYLPLVNGGRGTTVIAETTEVLGESTLALLDQVSADGAQFTFSQNTPELTDVQAGDVIVGSVSDATPDGFLRQVTAKHVANGQVIVETVPASLDQVIVEGSFSLDREFAPADVSSAWLAEGVTLLNPRSTNATEGFHFNLKDAVVYDKDDNPATKGDQIKLNGEFEISPGVEFKPQWKNGKLNKVEFVLKARQTADVELRSDIELFSFKKEFTIVDLKMGTIIFYVGFVPVVVTIEMPITVNAEGNITIGLSLSRVEQSATARGGLRWEQGDWDLISDLDIDFDYSPPTVVAELDTKFYPQAKIWLRLYGALGPYVALQPFGQLKAEWRLPATYLSWELYAGLELPIGIKFRVLGKNLLDYEDVAISHRVLLARSNQPPNVPYNPQPVDAATGVAGSLRLSWQGGDPEGDPVEYHVYMEATPGTPGNKVCDGTSNLYCDVSSLLPNTTYYWQVVAFDADDQETPGPVWSFTTAGSGNSAPYAPSNPTPPHQATNQNVNTQLLWVGGDPDGDPVTYAVYLEADDSSPDALVCPVANTATCAPGALSSDKTYYWQVIASDNQGHTTTGPVWRFTTRAAPEPPVTVDVVLIIDSSGSMLDNDPAGLRKEAAKVFVDTMVNNDMVSIVDFDGGTRVAYPLQAVTDDRSAVKAAINTIDSSGSTNIGAGLQTGYNQLLSSPNTNPKAAVLLTDGQGNYNNQANLYKDQGWPVFTIGLSSSADEQLLRAIANETGGQYFALTDPNQLIQVYFAIQSAISGSDVIVTTDLTMSQGQTETVPVTLSANQNTGNFVVTWPGSRVDTKLIDPTGRVITPDTALSDPYVYHAKGPTYEVYRISYPMPGEWDVQLYGADLAPGGETVSLQVSQRDNDLSSDWQPVSPGSASGGGISNTSGASQTVSLAAGPNNTLYLAWSDTSSGDAEIYLRRWDGAAWSELGGSAGGGGISNNSGASLWPSVAVGPDGNPWVAWHDETPGAAEIYVRRWTGTAWEPVGSGSASGGGISNTSGGSQFVDLQIPSNGQAVAVWSDDSAGNAEIYLRQWNGSAWVALAGSATAGGISNSANRSGRPAVAIDAGLPTVAWAEAGSVGEIYLRRYNGSAWVELGNHSASGGGVSNTSGASQYATLTYTTAGKPYVAWYDAVGGQREIYAATLEGGQWVAAGTGAASGGGVSNTTGESKEPNLVASGSPFLVWQETTATDNEIYVRRLSGASWLVAGSGSATGGGISNNSGESLYPEVALTADGRLYVAWEDNSSGNYEVYILMNAAP